MKKYVKNKDEYKDKIVCYFDILGWKDKIKITENDVGKTKKLYVIYKSFVDSFKLTEQGHPTLKVNIISDSFFISWNTRFHDITMKVINILKFRLQAMIMDDIIVRGGIYKGKFLHEDDILFGPALNKAYELESKCSIYPRIIFDEEIRSEFFSRYSGKKNDPFNNYTRSIKKDSDGFYYLDYLNYHKNTDLGNGIDQMKFYSKLKGMILNGLNNSKPNVKMKYEWLKDKFNIAITENINDEELQKKFVIV